MKGAQMLEFSWDYNQIIELLCENSWLLDRVFPTWFKENIIPSIMMIIFILLTLLKL